jgi:pyruvate dehydrogenase E2 component (dihydrolipoamide acetyltransferase)
MAETIELRVPDLGDFHDVPVIEVLVKPGDAVKKNDALLTLESDKASMEVPAERDGIVAEVKVKIGDKVSRGTPIVTLRGDGAGSAQPVASPAAASPAVAAPQTPSPNPVTIADFVPAPPRGSLAPSNNGSVVHASPAIRRFARELGVALSSLRGSGPNGRVTRGDVQEFVKAALEKPTGASGSLPFALPPWPKVDFAKYGAIERAPLPRIKKIAGPNLHRNWLQIPHITNYDEADITQLEEFRNAINVEQNKRSGPKLTMLAFLIAASVVALKRFPEFNASLDGESIIYKRYYNIGFAADTPDGLVVPVVRNADGMGLLDLARATADLASKARHGKLVSNEMSGGTFTISSIGGIGGTGFTQIVNAPEVAILGAVRADTKPVWNGQSFAPRLMLPISVSYDHRVIDGALAARFLRYIADLLADFRRVTL